jgi:hypothetical protein
MKKIIFAGMLLVLLAAALLVGCSQPAVNPPGPKQPATANPSQTAPPATGPAAGTANATAPADNGSSIAAAPPALAAATTTRIGDILQDPRGFDGKTVIVEGKIASECPSGCWFTLKDGNAVIYIDLNPSNLVIPQRKGSNAKVTAKVVTEGSDVYLIGNKVDF